LVYVHYIYITCIPAALLIKTSDVYHGAKKKKKRVKAPKKSNATDLGTQIFYFYYVGTYVLTTTSDMDDMIVLYFSLRLCDCIPVHMHRTHVQSIVNVEYVVLGNDISWYCVMYIISY
jgi:hypothetical protein